MITALIGITSATTQTLFCTTGGCHKEKESYIKDLALSHGQYCRLIDLLIDLVSHFFSISRHGQVINICEHEAFLLFESNFECTNNPETIERTSALQKCHYFSNRK